MHSNALHFSFARSSCQPASVHEIRNPEAGHRVKDGSGRQFRRRDRWLCNRKQTGFHSSQTSWTAGCRRIASMARPLLTFIILLAWSANVSAQEEANATPGPESVPHSISAGVERFVPASELEDVLRRIQKSVVLPRAEYDELMRKVESLRKLRAEAPTAIAIRSVDYVVEQAGNHAALTVTLDVEQFLDGWASLRLPLGKLLPENISVGGTPAFVGIDPEDREFVRVFHRTQGRFELIFKLSAPLVASGTDRIVSFPVVPGVPGRLTVACPPKQVPEVNGVSLGGDDETDESYRVSVPLGSVTDVNLRWTSRDHRQSANQMIFVQSDLTVDVRSLQHIWKSECRVSIFGDGLRELSALIPAGLEVTSVDSAGLESWKLEDVPNTTGIVKITLMYRQPVSGIRMVRVSGVAGINSESESRVATLEFPDVMAHSGRVYLPVDQEIGLISIPKDGIRRIGTGPAPNGPQQAEIFEFWNQNFVLNVATRPRERELFGDFQSALTISDTTMQLATMWSIETLSAPLFEIAVLLPSDWSVQSVTDTAGGLLSWRHTDVDGKIMIEPGQMIPEGGLFDFRVTIDREVPDLANAAILDLPLLRTETDRVVVVGGTYSISAADDLNVTATEMSGFSPAEDQGAAKIFESRGTKHSGKLLIERKTPRLSGRSVLTIWSDTRQITTDIAATVDIVHGTVRSLSLRTPPTLGTDLRFSVRSIEQVPGITGSHVPDELRITEQNVQREPETGELIHDLKFNRWFNGAVTLHGQAHSEIGVKAEEAFVVPVVKIDNADRQHGLIVLEAYPDQQITTEDQSPQAAKLQTADPGAVTCLSEERRIAAVLQFAGTDYDLRLRTTQFDTTAVPNAICQVLNNTSTLADNGTCLRSAVAKLKCSGVQTIGFRFPAGQQSHLWSATLNDAPVEVRIQDGDYLISLPSTISDTAFTLELTYEATVPEPRRDQEYNHRSPMFFVESSDGDSVPVNIVESTWEVRVSPDARLVKIEGNYQPLDFPRIDQPGWLHRLLQQVRIPRPRDLTRFAMPVGILLLIVFSVTAMVCGRRWKTLGILCLLIAVIPLVLDVKERAMIGGTAIVLSTEDEFLFDRDSDEPQLEERLSEQLIRPDLNAVMDTESDNLTAGGVAGRRPGIGGFGGGGFEGITVTPETPFDALDRTAAPVVPPGQTFNSAGNGQISANPTGSNELAGEPNTVPHVIEISPPTSSSEIEEQARPLRKGTARLSVKASLDVPEGFVTHRFRSISGSNDKDSLTLRLQNRNQINALRLIAATIVLLLIVRQNFSFSRLVAVTAAILLSVIGLIPLAAQSVQGVLDGIAVGAIVGVLMRILWGAIRLLRSVATGIRRRVGRQQRRQTLTTVAGLLVVAATTTARADEVPDGLRPDVILPYTVGRPELLADRVLVPHEDFLKLYREVYPEQLTQQTPQSRVVAAFYQSGERSQVRDQVWTQRFIVRYVIRKSSTTPEEITVPLGEVAVRTAKIDGRNAVLLPTATKQPIDSAAEVRSPTPTANSMNVELNQGNQRAMQAPAQNEIANRAPQQVVDSHYRVRVTTSGTHLLDIEFEVMANIEGSIGELSIPVRPVPAGVLQFDPPSADLEVSVDGRPDRLRRDGERLTIPISAARDLQIQWRPESELSSSNVVFHATAASGLTIDNAGMTLRSSIDLTMRQGQLAEVVVAVPGDFAVIGVDGGDISGWSKEETDPGRLRVRFRQPITTSGRLNLTMFQRKTFQTERQMIDVPIPAIVGASRDSGILTLLAGREFEVRSQSLSSVTQVNPAEAVLPEHSDNQIRRALSWRYTRHPAEVTVQIRRVSDEMKAAALHGVQLEGERQVWTSRIAVSIHGSPRRRLEVSLPADFLPLDVQSTRTMDWFLSHSSDSASPQLLNIEFDSAVSGTVHMTIQGQRDREFNAPTEVLTAPAVLLATDLSSDLSIWLDAASEIAEIEVGNWKHLNGLSEVQPDLLALHSSRPTISLSNAELRPSDIRLQLRPAVANLAAESVVVTNVTDTSVELTLGLNWQIDSAAVRDFSFVLPQWIAERLDYQVQGLRQIRQEKQEGDLVKVTVSLQQPVSDRLFILGTGTMARPVDGTVQLFSPEFTAGGAKGVRFSERNHYQVIVNQSAGVLEPTAISADSTVVSPEQIRTRIPPEFLQQAVSITRSLPGVPLIPWRIRFPKQDEATPAVVTLAAHTTILDEDGSWRSRHQLEVRNESRQFLPVRLPDDCRLLYCLVGGQPTRMVSRPSAGRTMSLIPIPQGGRYSSSFLVEFAVAGRIPSPRYSLTATPLHIPVPTLPDFRDDPDYGITVTRNTWSVFVPEGWQTSVDLDPRATNVVSASVEEMDDAIVLSTVDNARSLVRSLDTMRRSSSHVLSDLQQQQLHLDQQRGNMAITENERASVLRELSEAIQKQVKEQSQSGIQQELPQSHENRFLLGIEQDRNSSTITNNGLFFRFNTPGTKPDVTGGTQFNFALPPVQAQEADKRVEEKATLKRPAIAGKELQEGKSESRSQLLRNRDAKLRQNASEMKDGAATRGLQGDAFKKQSEVQLQQQMPDPFGLPAGIAIPNDSIKEDAQELLNSEAQQRESQGSLSLKFNLPTAGTELRFMRTTGNPTLALRIRNDESVTQLFKLGWLIVCGLAAVHALKASTFSLPATLKSVAFTVGAISMTGLILLNGDHAQVICGLVCLTAAVLFAAVLIWESYRKVDQYSGQ